MAQQQARNVVTSFMSAVQSENGATVAQFLKLSRNDAVVNKLRELSNVNWVRFSLASFFAFGAFSLVLECRTVSSRRCLSNGALFGATIWM